MNPNHARPMADQLENQPANFPTFYLIPETHYVRRQRAANSHIYQRPTATTTSTPSSITSLPYLQQQIAQFQEAAAKLTVEFKAGMRIVASRLCRWLLLPLAILACLVIAEATPAELAGPHGGPPGASISVHCSSAIHCAGGSFQPMIYSNDSTQYGGHLE